MQDELRKLVARIDGLLASARGAQSEADRAATDVESLERLHARALDAEASGDDQDLAALVEEDVVAIRAEVERLESAGTLASSFFHKPTARRPRLEERTPVVPTVDKEYRNAKPTWAVRHLDLEHPKNWIAASTSVALSGLIDRLGSFETMTWREIDKVPHAHPWDGWETWSRQSKDRIHELELDDRTGWYQLPMTRMGRVLGFRVGQILHLVWWDRDHEVYVTGT